MSIRAWLGRSGRGNSYGIEGRGREGLDQWLCSSQAYSTEMKNSLSMAVSDGGLSVGSERGRGKLVEYNEPGR
jgi:hypothetical protein